MGQAGPMDETRRTVYPIVVYTDADAGLRFLRDAFGFEEKEVHRDGDGRIVHAELVYDTGVIMTGDAGSGSAVVASPASIYVAVDDVDAHHDRAVAAGAKVVRPLTDTDYGSRDYAAEDPEGNTWYFGTYRP